MVGNQSALFGELTNQFAELSKVWQTYRLDHVIVEFTPSGFQGLGYNAPALSIVDAGGVPSPLSNATEILGQFSRSRTVNVTSPL